MYWDAKPCRAKRRGTTLGRTTASALDAGTPTKLAFLCRLPRSRARRQTDPSSSRKLGRRRLDESTAQTGERGLLPADLLERALRFILGARPPL